MQWRGQGQAVVLRGGGGVRVGKCGVNMVGGERTTCASTASSLKLRRANARRPLTHSVVFDHGPVGGGAMSVRAGDWCSYNMQTCCCGGCIGCTYRILRTIWTTGYKESAAAVEVFFPFTTHRSCWGKIGDH